MKISKQEKVLNRKKIIKAAVRVISDKGFQWTSLREIAKNAQIPEPTIYKYFSAKEDILYSYFENHVEELLDQLKKIKGFEQFTFQEQFHSLLDTMLDLLEPDRAFVRTAYQGIFLINWVTAAKSTQPSKERFMEILNDLIEVAVEVGEFEDPPFRDFVIEILWEYSIAVTYYWLNDVSPKYENTTQLIDKSLSIIVSCLESSILGKSYDLIKFLIREHILSKINQNKSEHSATKLKTGSRESKRKIFEDS